MELLKELPEQLQLMVLTIRQQILIDKKHKQTTRMSKASIKKRELKMEELNRKSQISIQEKIKLELKNQHKCMACNGTGVLIGTCGCMGRMGNICQYCGGDWENVRYQCLECKGTGIAKARGLE